MTAQTLLLSQVLETDSVKCGIHNGHIFYSYMKPNTLITAKDLEFVFNHHETLTKGKKIAVLAEMGKFSTMDKSAREFLQQHKTEAICEAAVIYNLSQRMLINFYHAFKSHSHPSKVFKSVDNAIEWINSFR